MAKCFVHTPQNVRPRVSEIGPLFRTFRLDLLNHYKHKLSKHFSSICPTDEPQISRGEVCMETFAFALFLFSSQ